MEYNQNEDTLQFNYAETTEQTKSIIKVVGVGGGGSNAVRNMYQEGIEEVTYLIINTDKKALQTSVVPNKLQISEDGLGAGADPDKAEAYALQYEEAIRNALNDGTKMVFITAGMGGGTGTGASPVVARIARELGILTIGIVTIPFDFEGIKKIQKALSGVAKIRQNVDALLVVNNTRLADIYPDLNFFNAFRKADDTLTIAAKSISDIINITGYINLDFEDVKKTLENSGVALISTGQASGENRLSKAIENATTSPLLQDNEITHAQRLLFEVCFSEDHAMTMSESHELNEFVGSLDPNIDVIWGALVDNSLGEDIRIIVLAAGFELDSTVNRITPKPMTTEPRQVMNPVPSSPVNREDRTPVQQPVQQPVQSQPVQQPVQTAQTPSQTPTEAVQPQTIAQPQPTQNVEETPVQEATVPAPATQVATEPVQPVQTPVEQPAVATEPATIATPIAQSEPVATEPRTPQITPTQDPMQGLEEIRKYYGAEVADGMRMDQIRKNYYLLDQEDLTNEQLVSMLEHMPAYNRSYEQLCELKNVSKSKPISSQANPPKDGSIF